MSEGCASVLRAGYADKGQEPRNVGKAEASQSHKHLLDIVSPFIFLAIAIAVRWVMFSCPDGACLEDDMTSNIPMRSFLVNSLRHGELPFWNPYNYLGAPCLADPLFACLYPVNLALLILPTAIGYPFIICAHMAFAAWGTFLYLRKLKCALTPCFFGALVFMLSGYLTGHTRHAVLQNAAAWLPWLFFCWESLRLGQRRYSFIGLVLIVALQVLGGSAETALRSALFLGLYGGFRRLGSWRRTFLTLIAAYGLAVALCMCQLIPTAHVVQESARASLPYAVFCETSLHPSALLGLVIPYLYGSELPGLYPVFFWGRTSPWEAACYVGIVPLVLALRIGVTQARRDGLIRVWTVLMGTAVILALGQYTPLHRVLYHVPGFNLFRAPGRFVLYFDFGVSVLFARALAEMLTQSGLRGTRATGRLLILVAMVLALSVMITQSDLHTSFFVEPIAKVLAANSAEIIQATLCWDNPTILIPIGVLGLSGGSLILASRSRWRSAAIVLLLVITSAELSFFSATFDGTSKQARQRSHDLLAVETVPAEMHDTIIESRCLSLGPWSYYQKSLLVPNTNLLVPVRSVNGYFPLVNQKFMQMFGFHSTVPSSASAYLLYENRLISTFGARYLIGFDDSLGRSVREWPWDVWAASGNESQRYSEMKPLAVQKPAQWQNGVGILRREDKSIPVIVFSIPHSTFRTYRCTFDLRAQDLADANMNVIAVVDGTVIASHSLVPDPASTRFTKARFTFGNTREGQLQLHFYTHSEGAFEIENIILEEMGVPENVTSYVNSLGNGTVCPYRLIHSFDVSAEPPSSTQTKFCIAENLCATPIAHLVSHIIRVKDFDEACDILGNPSISFNPATDALVQLPELCQPNELSPGTATILSSRANKVSIQCMTEGRSFLVFSDSYDEGWKAEVNGETVAVFRTNGLVKGVFVPKGRSIVEFSYTPPGLRIGIAISVGSLFLLMLIALAPIVSTVLPARLRKAVESGTNVLTKL